MTLSTYQELQDAITDELNRTDLDSVTPTFIRLAEAQISRQLRHFKMIARETADLDDAYLAVPEDWVETKRLHLQTNPVRVLEIRSSEEVLGSTAVGQPNCYTMAGEFFHVAPAPDTTYTAELLYYSAIPALTANNTTNWLLTRAPDVYLYGALSHTAPYLQEDSRLQTWLTLFTTALSDLNRESENALFSNDRLIMRAQNGRLL